jgi:Domain of unknown function (DUF4268)
MRKIIVTDRDTKTPRTVEALTFEELDIQELNDLEEWIKSNTDILGSRLLLITSEFDEFDKSHKRLDLLALDQQKKLVVIELKRDATGTLADLQAIRYAAFCSTLIFDEMVRLRAKYAKTTIDNARKEIQDFVEDQGFSKLDNRPRIILAAGAFEDQELTSCVLWLRSFGVDISCVEVTPYRISDGGQLVLVPRVVIPLPKEADYIVQIEKKETEQTLRETERVQLRFWEGFVQFCKDKGAAGMFVSEPRPIPWYAIKMGLGGIWIELKVTTQPPALTCQLVIQLEDSASVFRKLEEAKEAIHKELGEHLEWKQPPENGKRGRILLTKAAQVESEDEWTGYFGWLKEHAESFYNAFLPRLRTSAR